MDLPFSRRDFLKVTSAGLLGLFLADLRLDRSFAASVPKLGRVTLSGVELLSEPFYRAKKIYAFGRDEVVDIRGEVEGDNGYGNPFNSTWYQVNGDGYVYSGLLQPVEMRHQKPVFDIPRTGRLGEITIPFCDTRRDISILADRGYRLYYSSTHWVTDVVVNQNEKSIWYKLYDRESKKSLYAPTHAMRLILPDETDLLSPDVPEEKKYIYVDLKTQSVTAFEQEKPVRVARCSSGDEGTETPSGEFRTYHKGPSIHMTNQGDAVANIFDLPGVPWVSFFTGSGAGFHGTYWHNDYGRPRSHGCVNLTPDDAKFIYRWTRPRVPPETPYLYQPGEGTLVRVASSA